MTVAQPAAPSFRRAMRDFRTAPSTPHQRLFISCLMGKVEIDPLFATLFHRRFFEAAGLPAPEPGTRLDTVLQGLNRGQASALIEQLQKELRHDDE